MAKIEFEEYKVKLTDLEPKLSALGDSLGLGAARESLERLHAMAESDGFWNDTENSQKVTKQIRQLENKISGYEKMCADREDLVFLCDMAIEEDDDSMLEELVTGYEDLEARMEQARLETLLTGEYDGNNVLMSFHAGAGGTEAQDWCQMLYRMYTRWAEKKGYSIEVLDYLDGDEAGIKSVTIQITGLNAYGYLKSEHGVHRLVRISPFNAVGKRMTSFVSCDVMPVIEQSLDVDIKDDDLKIDVYRSSGAGGQHINKTSSAVRITHLPTGIVVACQNERSHYQNLDKAMEMLKAKLYLMKKAENEAYLSGIRGEVMENGWGSQIRSYVFQPYTMVKDLRTEAETSNLQQVMDGGLDYFMNAYLKWIHQEKKPKQ